MKRQALCCMILAACSGPVDNGNESTVADASGTAAADGGGRADAAATPDAGATDSGLRDAGVYDAGPGDAAAPDAWQPADGGTPDGAFGLDAGSAQPDAAMGWQGFEQCCQDTGCMDDPAMMTCMAYPAAYGDCSVSAVAGRCVDVDLCGGTYVNTAGFCPGPANIQCCTPATGDGGVCTAADRPTPNSGIEPQVFTSSCPPGMRVVAGVCVDVYEAFVRQVLPDGGWAEWSPYFNPGTMAMVAISAAGAVPQGYINADQAEAACQAAGKRLCSNTEWLRACKGPNGFTYPYGNTRQPGVCNDARAVHPAVELYPNDPNPFTHIQEPCINQLPASLDVTGENGACTAAEGLLDMMGNLHEWTSDPAGTFRGGFYVDTYRNGNGCDYVTTAHNRLHWDYSTGFRCCADPLP